MNIGTSQQNTGAWAKYTSKSANSVNNTDENGFLTAMNGMSASPFTSNQSQTMSGTTGISSVSNHLDDIYFPDYQKGEGSLHLEDEDRHVLTQEEIDYFAEKYGDGNMDLEQWDNFLYELQELGVISKSERVTAGGFLVPVYTDDSGSLESSMIVGSGSAMENGYSYHNNPMNYLTQMKEKSWDLALKAQKEGFPTEEMVQDSFDYGTVLSVLENILGNASETATAQSSDAETLLRTMSSSNEFSQSANNDPELEALKAQMNLLLDNNYSRARFQEVSDNEEEEARWEALLEYVDRNIEDMKEIAEERKEELLEQDLKNKQYQQSSSTEQSFFQTNTNNGENNPYSPSIFSTSYGSDADDAVRAEMNGILDGSWNRKKMAELAEEATDEEDESLRDLMEAMEYATKNRSTLTEEELEALKKGASSKPAVAVTAAREENSSVHFMGDMA